MNNDSLDYNEDEYKVLIYIKYSGSIYEQMKFGD